MNNVLSNVRSRVYRATYIVSAVLFTLMCGLDIARYSVANAATTNLLANPSVESKTNTGIPNSWASNSWGTNTASLTTTSDAHSGTTALSTSLTARQDGDAKWMPDAVAITPGTTYTYTEFYKSTSSSEIDAAYTDASGKVQYVYIGSAAPATSWQQISFTFTAPTGMQSLRIMHILASVGSVTSDDFSLVANTPVTPPVASTIANPSFEESSDGTSPAFWMRGNWGANSATFSYANDGHTGSRSGRIDMTSYVNGDAKWYFTPVTLAAGEYTFNAWYKGTVQPQPVVVYTMNDGSIIYSGMAQPAKANATTWQKYSAVLSVPSDVKNLSVFMMVAQVGWLAVDDYAMNAYAPTGFNQGIVSLTFDDGWQDVYTNGLPLLKKYGFKSTQYILTGSLNTPDYMTTSQVRAFQTQGSEIASHTVNHFDLTTLTASQLSSELTSSQSRLRRLYGNSVATNFASPYGAYNATTVSAIKKYYGSHRSVDTGFNSKDNFNQYNIVVQNIEVTTTNAQVQAWVNKAKADRTWLVLVYHQVENDPATATDTYAVSTANLDAHLAYIKSTGISVQTVQQALTTVKAQL
ncbi:polysaccharide deacetylase family protein [Candidatus Saccharibacteria bacterium]|nr:polysaccharide deacetylase family protein [Candidatus Saccharibacteria bacterium]